MKRNDVVQQSLGLLGVVAIAVVLCAEAAASIRETGTPATTRVSIGPNAHTSPPQNQADEFKSRMATSPPTHENIDFHIQVCCLVNNCTAPDTPGVRWTKKICVTGSTTTICTSTANMIQCDDSCDNWHVILQDDKWGPPATNVTVEIEAECVCCDGAVPVPNSEYGQFDLTGPNKIELDPTDTSPDPWDP